MIYLLYIFVLACMGTNLNATEKIVASYAKFDIYRECPFPSCKKQLRGPMYTHLMITHNYCSSCSEQLPDRIETAIHVKEFHKNQNLFKYLITAQSHASTKDKTRKTIPIADLSIPIYDYKKQCSYPSCTHIINDNNEYDHIARRHNTCNTCKLQFDGRQELAVHIYQQHPERIKTYAYLIACSTKYRVTKKSNY